MTMQKLPNYLAVSQNCFIFAEEFVNLIKFKIMKKKRITVFDEYGIIISIKNNTFLLNYLVNSIIIITFATPNLILL